MEQLKSASSELPSEYYEAEKGYRDITNMDISNNRKGLAYYKLAVLYTDFRQEKKAEESLKTASTLAEKEALISRIHRMLEAERRILLRASPKLVSDLYVADVIKERNLYDSELNESGSFANDFVDNGDGTITDRAIGLMWQKAGSSSQRSFKRSKLYVRELNKGKFAGYSDWRLPTIEELASLVEKEKINGLHTNPVFNKKQATCWSSDEGPPDGSHTANPPQFWHINFREGKLGLTALPSGGGVDSKYYTHWKHYVRAVRSKK